MEHDTGCLPGKGTVPAATRDGAILQHGIAACPDDWHVDETTAPGFCRIYHVTRGGLVYADDQDRIVIAPGTLVIMPETKPYRLRHNPADPLGCVFFHASLLPLVFWKPALIAVEPESLIDLLLHTTRRAMENRASLSLLQHLCHALIELVSRQLSLSELEPPVRRSLLWLQAHYRESPTLDDLCRQSGWHKQHFIRRFRSALGITPHQYLIRYRLHKASLLLLQGCSASDAASAAGYPDLKPFSKAFRSHYGIAPSQYRTFFTPRP